MKICDRKMTIIDYYASDDQSHWLEEIKKSDWSAGQYLYELLRDHRLKELCGQKAKLLMLAEDEKLISFCTYAEQDDVREPALTPWVGFVYTFPGYRGKRYMGIASRLVEHALSALKAEGINKVALLVFNYNETGNAFWGAACQWHAFSTD